MSFQSEPHRKSNIESIHFSIRISNFWIATLANQAVLNHVYSDIQKVCFFVLRALYTFIFLINKIVLPLKQ